MHVPCNKPALHSQEFTTTRAPPCDSYEPASTYTKDPKAYSETASIAASTSSSNKANVKRCRTAWYVLLPCSDLDRDWRS